MRRSLFLVLLFVIAFTCRAQQTTPENQDINKKELSVTAEAQAPDQGVTTDESAMVKNSVNGDEVRVEKEKINDQKITDKKARKKGRRGGNSNTVIYVIAGIVVVALVIYLVTSSSTTKM